MYGQNAGDRLGTSVDVIDDATGDGIADFVAGAPRRDSNGTDSGTVYLFSGASGAIVRFWDGEGAGDRFGEEVRSGNRVLASGVPSVVVGAPLNDVGGNNAGAMYVYSAISGAQREVLRGDNPSDWFGGAVGSGGDVDGDGIGDVVVGARLSDFNGPNSGTAEVYSFTKPVLTWYVDALATPPGIGTQSSPYSSIQYAVDRGPTHSGHVLSIAPGTYFENVDLREKSLRLVGMGAPGAATIEGSGSAPCLRIAGGQSRWMQVENMTLQGGNEDLTRDGLLIGGGGALCDDVTVTFRNCVFTDNESSEWGAGTLSYRSQLSFVNCSFDSNGANPLAAPMRGGGAIAAEWGSIEITGGAFNSNLSGGSGGAIVATSCPVTVSGATFSSNASGLGDGGAIHMVSGHLSLQGTLFENNAGGTNGAGGAIAIESSATIDNCTFDSNVTGIDDYHGGGIYALFASGQVDVTASIFEGNQSAGGGGAAGGSYFDCLFVDNVSSNSLSLSGSGGGLFGGYAERCTFVGNMALGGGSGPQSGAGGAAVNSTLFHCNLIQNSCALPMGGGGAFNSTLENCIVYFNSPNSLDGSSSATYSDIDGGFAGTGNINADPLFWDLAAGDLHLTALSPCIDAGNPASPKDPDGSRADMGVFPYDPNYCPPPSSYCTAKTNSCGGTPTIGWSGASSASASSGFLLTATGARDGKAGIVMYSSNGAANIPFQGGTLCVAPQGLKRGPSAFATGGTGGAACDATFSIDWNAFAAGTLGQAPPAFLSSPGQVVHAQWWGRDSLAAGSFLSDALSYTVCP